MHYAYVLCTYLSTFTYISQWCDAGTRNWRQVMLISNYTLYSQVEIVDFYLSFMEILSFFLVMQYCDYLFCLWFARYRYLERYHNRFDILFCRPSAEDCWGMAKNLSFFRFPHFFDFRSLHKPDPHRRKYSANLRFVGMRLVVPVLTVLFAIESDD